MGGAAAARALGCSARQRNWALSTSSAPAGAAPPAPPAPPCLPAPVAAVEVAVPSQCCTGLPSPLPCQATAPAAKCLRPAGKAGASRSSSSAPTAALTDTRGACGAGAAAAPAVPVVAPTAAAPQVGVGAAGVIVAQKRGGGRSREKDPLLPSAAACGRSDEISMAIALGPDANLVRVLARLDRPLGLVMEVRRHGRRARPAAGAARAAPPQLAGGGPAHHQCSPSKK